MAITAKMYLCAYFDADAKFSHYFLSGYKPDPKQGIDRNGLIVMVSEHELSVPEPTGDPREYALAFVGRAEEATRAAMRDQLQHISWLKNQLLALPAPDVVDASPLYRLNDNDIPF